MQTSFVPLLAAAAALLPGVTVADGPSATAVAARAPDPGLARACIAAAARITDAPPASIYVYGVTPSGGVAMWAGGAQVVCRAQGPDRVAFFRVLDY